MLVNIRPDNKEVLIEDHDLNNIDQTLSLIILPLLKKLRNSPDMGIPFTFNEDVPEELRLSEEELDSYSSGHAVETEQIWTDRWKWIVDEMIWSFEFIASGRSLFEVFDGEWSQEKADKFFTEWDRSRRGTTLFGKYLGNLWT